jgi:arsenate reductase
VEIWYNPNCSKCRGAAHAFDQAGLTYRLRYYLEKRPSVTDLRDILERLSLEPWDICRTADAKPAGIALPSAKDADHREAWIDVLVANPVLIQRPIVVTDDGAAYVARDPHAIDTVIERSKDG